LSYARTAKGSTVHPLEHDLVRAGVDDADVHLQAFSFRLSFANDDHLLCDINGQDWSAPKGHRR
jgi:hypothetical protein